MLNIYGIYARDEMPVMDLVAKGLVNSQHANHIEIARDLFREESNNGRTYDAIMVIVGSDQARVFKFK